MASRKISSARARPVSLSWGSGAAETARIAARLNAAGDARVAFVAVPGLAMSGCDYHPSTADDQIIADRLATYVEAHPALWTGR